MSAAREALRRTGVTRLLWRRKAETLRRYHRHPRDHLGYVLADPEIQNFTYDIENRDELMAWLDHHLGSGAGSYVRELDGDAQLRRDLASKIRWRPNAKFQHFGRRLGWYAVVRWAKPALVVETGTHDGLGSVALLAALIRNVSEGDEGHLVSIDPRVGTGWLVPDRLQRCWTPVRATSYEAFPSVLDGRVPDVFIHDSVHTAECESWELRTALGLGTPILISDNSHASPVLQEIAEAAGARYAFFRERPRHWYPGGGIGLATIAAREPN